MVTEGKRKRKKILRDRAEQAMRRDFSSVTSQAS